MKNLIKNQIKVLLAFVLLYAGKGFAYDPTAEPGFLGPEVVSGPDETAIPGGAFKLEKYALSEASGIYSDGRRTSSILVDHAKVQVLSDGQVYIVDKILQSIFLVKGDRLYKIAGSGVRGDKDGPAEGAEFCFGQYATHIGGLALDTNGDIYIADNENKKIKKLYKDGSGRLFVKTVAGGGNRALGVGDSCEALQAKMGGTVGMGRLCGPNNDHLYFVTGQSNYKFNYLLYPNGILKCVGYMGTDIPYGFTEKGYNYAFYGGNWASVCYKISKENGSTVKVAGYTDEEISVKYPGRVGLPVDGPVDDCTFHTTGGPMRPDGRAIYSIGGDELNIRRIMNGRVMTLNSATGAWFESRYQRFETIGCMSIVNLDWDGYAYLTWSYGGGGIWRAKLYDPLVKP